MLVPTRSEPTRRCRPARGASTVFDAHVVTHIAFRPRPARPVRAAARCTSHAGLTPPGPSACSRSAGCSPPRPATGRQSPRRRDHGWLGPNAPGGAHRHVRRRPHRADGRACAPRSTATAASGSCSRRCAPRCLPARARRSSCCRSTTATRCAATTSATSCRRRAIVLRDRPRVVVTSGAGATVPFCVLARLAGARVVFVETMARVTGPSSSGQGAVAARLARTRPVGRGGALLSARARCADPRCSLDGARVERTARRGRLRRRRDTQPAVRPPPGDRRPSRGHGASCPHPVVAQGGALHVPAEQLRAARLAIPDEVSRAIGARRVRRLPRGLGPRCRARCAPDADPWSCRAESTLGEHFDDHQTQIVAKLADARSGRPADEEISGQLEAAHGPLQCRLTSWALEPNVADALRAELETVLGPALDSEAVAARDSRPHWQRQLNGYGGSRDQQEQSRRDRRRRLHRRPPRRATCSSRGVDGPRGRRQAARRVVPASSRGREPCSSTCASARRADEAVDGAARRLQPRRRHGRHGLHREQQGRSACSRC